MAETVTDYAILIDATDTIGASLPSGTRRANTNAVSESYKIIIGKAPAMGTPFCNGIEGLPFIALPAYPNFPANGTYAGTFVIIGRNGSVPTYWGCNDVTELVAQCTVLNGGSNVYTYNEPEETGYLDAQGGNSEAKTTSCKLYLDLNGYALSNGSESFLNNYFTTTTTTTIP